MNKYKAIRILEYEKEWAVNRHVLSGGNFEECQQAFDLGIKALLSMAEIEDVITRGENYVKKEKIL